MADFNWVNAGGSDNDPSQASQNGGGGSAYGQDNLLSWLQPQMEGLGYQGDFYNGGNGGQDPALNPAVTDWMNQNGYNVKGGSGGTSFLSGLFKNGAQNPTAYSVNNMADPYWDASTAALGAAGGSLMGVGGLAGGGWAGNVAQGAFQGMVAGGQNFNPVAGAVTGAVGGALSPYQTAATTGNNVSAYVPATTAGFDPASMFGVSNPTLAAGMNGAAKSGLSALATGKPVLDSTIMGGAVPMGNSFFGQNFGSMFGGGADSGNDFSSLMGSGGDMSGQTDVSPNTYNESGNDYRYSAPSVGGSFTPTATSPTQQEQPQKSAFDFSSSMPSMSQVGNFVGGHAGDLASMLYGFYNNKRQQDMLGQQQSSLQGMFGPNSAYAQNLRNTMAAQAAAKGQRSNTGALEVALQANLAQHAAQLAPQMFQGQQAQMGLQNNRMNMLMQGMNKLGGWQGLSNMWSPPAGSLTGQGSLGAYGRMDDMYGGMPGG